MKKISIVLAVIIIAAVGLHAQEMKMLKVKVPVANIRAEPDMNGPVVKQVTLGAQLESRQKIGDWFEVIVTDDKGTITSGYINSGVVDIVIPGEAKPAAGIPTPGATLLKVKVTVASVRAEPDMNGPIVKQVTSGTQLESRQKIGDWFEVIVTDDKGTAISGYINSNLVDIVGPGGTIPAAQPVSPPVVQPTPQPSLPVPSPAPAPKVRAPWPSAMILARGAMFFPSNGDFRTFYGSSGFAFGGEFRLHVASGVFLSVDGGYYKSTGALTLTQEQTTMTLLPFNAMAIFHFMSGSIMPYIGAGGAGCKYKEENAIGTVDKWGFGFAVCGGATFHFGAFGLDAHVKFTSISVQPLETQVNLGGLSLGIAAGFIF